MNKWKTKVVSLVDMEATEVNANNMNVDDFNKLVYNIEKSGLSSMIACYERELDGKYVIISGNHRFKAISEIGYTSTTILYVKENEITKDEIIALQLSHNSLHGEDDKGILKRLMEEISTVEFKEFAHINIDEMESVASDLETSVTPVSEHFSVSLILYSSDIRNLEELTGIVKEQQSANDIVLLADGGVETQFLEMMSSIKKEFNIKSSSIAFGKILELAKVAKVTESE